MRNATQRDWRETLGLLILGWPVLPLLALAFSGLSRAVRRRPSAELVSLRRFGSTLQIWAHAKHR